MATGLIATRGTKVGDVLKYENDPWSGYCRTEATVTLPVGGSPVGAVFESTSVAGKYTLVVVATTANADGVLIDNRVYDSEYLVGGDFTLSMLTDGPSQVADKKLTYGADVDTQPEIDAVNLALTGNTGIKLVNQV